MAASAIFSPEEMIFDYNAGEFWLRYFIETIQRPDKEAKAAAEEPADTSAAESDSSTVKEDTKIYESADVPPEFPGGKEAMTQWLTNNIKYPAAAKKDNIKGVVTVTAVVEKNGSLSEVTVKKDIGGGCGAEVVRAVKLMPTWIPGQIKNEDKRVRVTISIFLPTK
jgi:protein TonB